MRRFFAETFYWIALLVRRDRWHERLIAFSHTLTHEDVLFTTEVVLLEFLTADGQLQHRTYPPYGVLAVDNRPALSHKPVEPIRSPA
jgi:hypothetical protein